MNDLMNLQKQIEIISNLCLKYIPAEKDTLTSFVEARNSIAVMLSELNGTSKIDRALISLEEYRLRSWGKERPDSVIRACEARIAAVGGYIDRVEWIQKLKDQIKEGE